MANKTTNNDITFIDPETFEVVCTYNGCSDKFEIKFNEVTKHHYPNKKQNRMITYNEQYRQCSECGRKLKLKIDERATISNRTSSIANTAKE